MLSQFRFPAKVCLGFCTCGHVLEFPSRLSRYCILDVLELEASQIEGKDEAGMLGRKSLFIFLIHLKKSSACKRSP